jgi:RES domain-containing protein
LGVILWRISDHATLDGGGGLSLSGRWHTAGRRIVYCAPNPATALLEVLVHTEIDFDDVPVNFRYLEIEVPDSLSVEDLDLKSPSQLWRTDLLATRQAGDQWLQSSRTALLRVPSVIVPATWNVLINPRHPESAQIRIARSFRHGPDPRLLR